MAGAIGEVTARHCLPDPSLADGVVLAEFSTFIGVQASPHTIIQAVVLDPAQAVEPNGTAPAHGLGSGCLPPCQHPRADREEKFWVDVAARTAVHPVGHREIVQHDTGTDLDPKVPMRAAHIVLAEQLAALQPEQLPALDAFPAHDGRTSRG